MLSLNGKRLLVYGLIGASLSVACNSRNGTNQNLDTPVAAVAPTQLPQPTAQPTPSIPNLQVELTDGRNKTTTSPIGKFDFKNYTYELPRGWQNPDGSTEIKLTNGKIAPVETAVNEKMDDESKAEAKS